MNRSSTKPREENQGAKGLGERRRKLPGRKGRIPLAPFASLKEGHILWELVPSRVKGKVASPWIKVPRRGRAG